MKNELENLNEEIYENLLRYHQQLEQIQQVAKEAIHEEEQEQIDRIYLALQAAKDVLENMVTPGKKMNFIYEKGIVSIEIFEDGEISKRPSI